MAVAFAAYPQWKQHTFNLDQPACTRVVLPALDSDSEFAPRAFVAEVQLLRGVMTITLRSDRAVRNDTADARRALLAGSVSDPSPLELPALATRWLSLHDARRQGLRLVLDSADEAGVAFASGAGFPALLPVPETKAAAWFQVRLSTRPRVDRRHHRLSLSSRFCGVCLE